jgi:hypothetical protein
MRLFRSLSLKSLLTSLFVLIIVGYTVFRIWPVIWGVHIKLDPIQNNDGLVTLSGVALHARLLTINDLPISEDEHGKFTFLIASLPGINRARLYGEDKFGHSDTRLVEWYYNSPNNLLDEKPAEEVAPPKSTEETNGIQETTKESTGGQ